MQKLIKFQAELDTTISPAEVRISAIENPWTDYGYLLEIMAFMCKVVMDHQEMTKEQVIAYTTNYLNKAMPDYKAKP